MSKNKTDKHVDSEVADEAETESLAHLEYDELLQKLNESEKTANQHWERILRMQADAENISRRNERDVSNAHKYALEKFVSELLPIIDSLELCLTSVTGEMKKAASSVLEGVELTLKMFYGVMEKFGVAQVNPVNEPFNPEFQQAISMLEDPKVPAGHVISVLQKGYTLNGRLVRPALVVVSKAKE